MESKSSRNCVITLCLALLFVAASCGKRQPSCTLKIDLQHVDDQTLYIFGTHKPFDRLDTVVLVDGKLKYQVPTDTVQPITILFNGTTLLPLYINKEMTVTITGDALMPDSIKVEGGDENLDLFGFLNAMVPDTLDAAPRSDVESYIVNHPFSQVSIYLLNQYMAQKAVPNAERLNTLMKSLSGMLQDEPLIESLLNQTDLAMKSDSGRFIANFRIRNQDKVYRGANYYKSKAMVVSFWASYDRQSEAMEDTLRKIRAKYNADDVNFVSVCLDMDTKRWTKIIHTDTINVEHMCECDGWNNLIVKQFGIHSLPTVVVLTPRQQVTLHSNDIGAIRKEIDKQVAAAKEERRIKEARERRLKEEQEARQKNKNKNKNKK